MAREGYSQSARHQTRICRRRQFAHTAVARARLREQCTRNQRQSRRPQCDALPRSHRHLQRRDSPIHRFRSTSGERGQNLAARYVASRRRMAAIDAGQRPRGTANAQSSHANGGQRSREGQRTRVPPCRAVEKSIHEGSISLHPSPRIEMARSKRYRSPQKRRLPL